MYTHDWGDRFGEWGMFGNWAGHEAVFAKLLLVAVPLFIILILWSVVWKGLALWHSGRRGQPWWFVILLLVNTLGILEIIYLFGVAKLKWGELFSRHEHRS